MKVGKIIYLCRKRMNLTQNDLAELSGLNRVTLGSWERGRNEPKVGDFIKLLNAMGFDLKIVRYERTEDKKK